MTRRSVSSTERPTGRSLMVIWRSAPVGEIIKSPLRIKLVISTVCHRRRKRVAQDDAEAQGQLPDAPQMI